ncbi:MAG TPA: helix-turn-helix domain-containing protein [Chitinophagaceae bacterium]|nr:helix-turn-helix domain-containing protein [Chitinophagaceae bacterium]
MRRQEGTATAPGNTRVPVGDSKVIADEKIFQALFQKANTTRKQVCPVRDIIARISDKWSLLAIYALAGHGTLRFNELKHKIGDVSQRMLTVSLRNLEKDGLITRTIHAEVPPRVEYKLTSLGSSLAHQLVYFVEWANTNSSEIIAARKK